MARNLRLPLWFWLACCLWSCCVAPAMAPPPSPTMNDVLRHYLHRIEQHDHLLHALENRMRIFWDRPLSIATACSGTDAVIKLMLRLDDVMQELCGQRTFATFFSQAFACESDDAKINFHSDQFGRSGVMFRDVCDLGNPMGAEDVYTSITTLIPWACLIIAGFSCKDASLQNARKRYYSDVIQTGERSTGSTWHGLLDYLDSVHPWAMLAENVEGLMSQVPIMKQQVENLGYLFHVMRLNAQDFCLPQKRPRVFFLIVRNIGEAVQFDRIDGIVSMLQTTPPLDIRKILERAGHTQTPSLTRADGDAAPRRSGVRASRNQVGARDEWVKRHREIFRENGLAFVIPTDQELGATAPDGVLALPLRERSIVQFWTLRGCVSGFLDVSEGLERFQAVHEDCLSCITTSASHFDFVEQKTVPLRALWDVQGLDWDAWTDLGRYHPRFLKDLAANAFSMPTVAAVLLAMLIVLPWPSSADEQDIWTRRGASGPPPTPLDSSTQSSTDSTSGPPPTAVDGSSQSVSDGVTSGHPPTLVDSSPQSASDGVRSPGRSGRSCRASDDDDDGDGHCGMAAGFRGTEVSKKGSAMQAASSQETEEVLLEADMRDLDLLATLG